MQSDPHIEFSRIITFDQIGIHGSTYHVEANEKERLLLAKRFHLVAIHSFKTSFTLSHAAEAEGYDITGHIESDVVQTCVSTLKDVPAHVNATFQILLLPSCEENTEEDFLTDLEEEKDIEYYAEEKIDLGETAAQYLSLNLDPFPHAPDAPLFSELTEEDPLTALAEALKKLKEK